MRLDGMENHVRSSVIFKRWPAMRPVMQDQSKPAWEAPKGMDSAALGEEPANRSAVARGRAGKFAIIIPWAPRTQGGVDQIVINLYKEIQRTGPFEPLVIVPDWGSLLPQERDVGSCRSVLMRIRTP